MTHTFAIHDTVTPAARFRIPHSAFSAHVANVSDGRNKIAAAAVFALPALPCVTGVTGANLPALFLRPHRRLIEILQSQKVNLEEFV